MKKLLFVTISLAVATVSSAQITISAARAQAIGNVVSIKGIVTSGSSLGTIRYMEDGTAGIAVYSPTLSSVQKGDTITVTGTLKNYNNLLELDPVSTFSIINSGNPLPSPTLVTPLQLDETNEGKLIQVNNAVFTNGGSTFSASTNYNFTSGGNTGQIRISPGINLVGKTIPIGPVTITGVLSQYCTSPTSGCLSGYQILVRDTNDIINNAPISIISKIAQTNIATTSFDLSWLTDSLGSTFIKYGITTNLELGFVNGVGNTTSHLVSLSGLTPATIYYAKAYSVKGLDTASTGIKAFATKSLSSGDIKIYFNTYINNSVSTGTNAIRLINAIDDTLISYIDRAKYTLDLTIYDFDNNNISNISTAINNAQARGVRVRFISDSANAPTNYGVNNLNASIQKIFSKTGSIYGIMHNKFVVIDANSSNPNDPLVWTGATNWTDNQINTDPNDVIIIQDQSLARAYTLEFEEMWGDTGAFANLANSKFGPDKTDNTPHEFLINNIPIQCYFSPSDNVNAKIIETVNSANSEVDFASMLVTKSDLANAIAAKAVSGVPTYGVVDEQSTTFQWNTLQTGMGVGYLVDYIPSYIMHHKYLIVDHNNLTSDPTLLTGSHNWSNAADQKNDENTLVIHDPIITNIFFQEFYELYNTNGGIGLVGIKDYQLENTNLMVFPNPASNKINVSSSSPLISIEIYDANGSLVKSISNLFTTNQEIDLSELSTGIYIIKSTGRNSVKQVRFCKVN